MRLLLLCSCSLPALAGPGDIVIDDVVGGSSRSNVLTEFDHNVALGLSHSPHEVVAQLQEHTSYTQAMQVARAVDCVVDHQWGHHPWFTLHCEGSVRPALAKLQHLPEVRWASGSFAVHLDAAPNDLTSSAWHHRNTGQTVGGSAGVVGADIGSTVAWDDTTGDASVIVSVIDTGVWVDHEDLVGRIHQNPGEICGNGKDDDGNGYVDDCAGWDPADNDNDVDPRDLPDRQENGNTCLSGHGTFIAGLIGAHGNNGKGTTGVMQDVRILPIKMAKNDKCEVWDSAVAEGVLYSIDQGARIVNVSWSFSGSTTTMAQAFAQAADADMLVVIAAGNNNRDIDGVTTYPIDYHHNNDVVVAATTNRDTRANFSNWGKTDVDVGAPGLSVRSLGIDAPDAYEPGNGTSYSAPIVAGIAGLLVSQHPELRAAELRASLLDGAEPIVALDCARSSKCVHTGGRVYAPGALDEAGEWASTPQIALDNLLFDDADWDADGQPERGESMGVTLRIRNDGHAPTANLRATLVADHAHITIVQDTAEIGVLNAYDTVSATGVSLRVALDCDDDALTTFRVQFLDSVTGQSWTDERAFTVGCDIDEDHDGHRYPEDCDDDNDAVFPGADERCNDVDDDCDDEVDEQDAVDSEDWYPDGDGDGFGGTGDAVRGCEPPEGYGAGQMDCDDTRTDVFPEADELCDGRDNDCDDEVDEDPVDGQTFHVDEDGDGWGDPERPVLACELPEGATARARDCDDQDAEAFPGSRTRRADCTERPIILGCACDSAPSVGGAAWLTGLLLLGLRTRRRHSLQG